MNDDNGNDVPSNDPARIISEMIEAAPSLTPRDFPEAPDPAEGDLSAPPSLGEATLADSKQAPSDAALTQISEAELENCAKLDQSDTDNGERLRAYFGRDILVLAEENSAGGPWLAWTGTHWDLATGPALVRKIAQKVGGLIGREADYINATLSEKQAIEAGDAAEAELRTISADLPKKERDWSDTQRKRVATLRMALDARAQAKSDIKARQIARRRFGVSSKNKARIENMLDAAAPHLRVPQEQFNADTFRVVTLSHTLQFVRTPEEDCSDPVTARWHVQATQAHRREDLVTALLPVFYDPTAVSKKWLEFLERFMPMDRFAEKRRTLQQYTGLGLLGVILQKFMFHYGDGANGKSVYLETITRLLGDAFAASLPPETFIGGGDRNAGGAAPDIMRLFGKRFLRVPEIKVGAPLQEDLVKRVTGGEKLTARTLFKGYIDFQNKAKPHMSGNGYPKIDGTDHGIWRRMLVMHWTETISEREQKDFENVVRDLLTEAPGILNWLIEGALDYLNSGLFVAPEVRAATDEYRVSMDTVGQFADECVLHSPSSRVQAADMYKAYEAWCGGIHTPVQQTRFGRVMKTRLKQDRSTGGRRYYIDCRLRDATLAKPTPPYPADDEVPT
jgi:putative DNA primase/helicase